MKLNRSKLLVIFSLVVFICTMLPVLTACEPEFDVKVVNGTDQLLNIYLMEGRSNPTNLQGSVEPGEHIYLRGLLLTVFEYFTITAKNEQDETVYCREFTYFELDDDFNFEVVITIPEED